MLRLPFRWTPGLLARSGSVLLGWMLLRAAAQAATVVLLARTLSASSYGAFVAIVAVAGFVVPIIGLGLSHIVLRNGATDPDHLPHYFQRAASVWWATLVPGIALAMGLAYWLLPQSLPLTAMLVAVIAEMVTTALTELRARQQQARHSIGGYGAINAGLPLLRLLVLGTLLWVTDSIIALAEALWAYAGASLAYALFLVPGMRMSTAMLKDKPTQTMPLSDGLPFCVSALAMRLQSEFNKPILLQADYGLAGSYNIAQRAIDIAILPLIALQEALWPRLYAQPNPLPQLQRTGSALLISAVLLGTLLWMAAPLLSWLIGPSFDEAVRALRLLAWLPVLQIGRSLMQFHFIHSKRIVWIGWTSVLGAVVSVASVLVLVPTYGLLGAVAATYVAEAIMFTFLVSAARRLAKPNSFDA